MAARPRCHFLGPMPWKKPEDHAPLAAFIDEVPGATMPFGPRVPAQGYRSSRSGVEARAAAQS